MRKSKELKLATKNKNFTICWWHKPNHAFLQRIHQCHIDIFDDFGKSSGLKINYNKTEILRIGSMKSSNSRLYTAKEGSWSNDSIRILGIEISVNNDIEKLNILPLISKMESIIKMWSWRQLILYGKITIINTLLLSQLIYRLTVLPSPSEATLRRIDKILLDYLWDGKPHKIAKKNNQQSVSSRRNKDAQCALEKWCS